MKKTQNNMENTEKKECPHCEQRKKEEMKSEEMNLAILLSLVPMLVLTLFSQVGLF